MRLRIKSLIWACATATLGLIAIVAHWDRIIAAPGTVFTAPPLPGVLLFVTLGTSVFVGLLAPRRGLGLRGLRILEWVGVVVTAAFFVLNQTLDLHSGTTIQELSMNLGAGFGAPWGAIAVGYGVLIPSSTRHSLVRTAVIAASAFIPELLTFSQTGLPEGALSFIAIKALTVAVMCALAIYGAYRIEELAQDIQAARQLGHYHLRGLLGEGGMGEVHLADHQFLRRPCAVKLIKPEQAVNEETLARFEREVQAAARLTHPNTIQIYDYGRAEDGTFYYVMEYLSGISLQDLVDRYGPMPPARAVRVLLQVCGALREAHACGLVHRDLKPGNVMLCERGGLHDVAKLLDYGLVAAIATNGTDAKLTQSGMILGTPEYMSPEQCAGDINISPSSDLYSVGALSYFLLTGASPFAGRSVMQMMAAHLYETAKPLTLERPEVDASLAEVVDKCLAKLPAKRYADMEALERALSDLVCSDEWTNEQARTWWLERQRSTAEFSLSPSSA